MSGRKPIIAANWKCMPPTKKAAVELIRKLSATQFDDEVLQGAEVIISPPALYTEVVKKNARKEFTISAQNCSAYKPGAFTGEISVEMLKDFGIKHTIIGHSERRTLFGETDAVVRDKVKRAMQAGLTVIACVGETLEERKSNRTLEVVKLQLKYIADGVTDWKRLIIAYEPKWAIGTGVVATPEQAQEVHKVLRDQLQEIAPQHADTLRLLYGGSVTAKNCAALMKLPDVDGFLVGGASLKPAEFAEIIRAPAKAGKLQLRARM